MPAPTKADQLFGEIAVKNRLLTRPQVDECLKALEKGAAGARTLAEAVEKKGFLSARAVASIARAQGFRDVRLAGKLYGRIAVKNKFATVDEVRECLEAQKKAYLKGEATPDLGELLRGRGHVTAEEDRAIQDAMRKLDKEALVGRMGRDADSDSSDLEVGEGLGAAEPPELPGKGGPARSGRARGERAAPAKSVSGKRPAAKRSTTAADSDEEALTLPPDGGPGAAAEAVPPKAAGATDSQGINVDDLLEDAENTDLALSPASSEGPVSSGSSVSSSSASDSAGSTSSSEQADGSAAQEDLSLLKESLGDDMQDFGPPTSGDTGDAMDVVVEPRDLAPPNLDETAGDGAAAPASTAPRGGGAAPRAGKTEAVEKTRAGTSRIELSGAAGARECPQCKVTLEPGTTQCLYCGHTVSKSEKQAGAPRADEAAPADGGPAPRATAGAADLGSEVEGAELLATCSRGDVLRGKDRRSGKRCLVWKLPDGVAPEESQVRAFEEDAKTLTQLKLRAVLDLRRVARAGDATLAIYDDAPGQPAVNRIKSGALDRMRAARVTREVAAAAAEAAKAGVFARELRPEGVFIPEEGEPKPLVIGFAVARLLEPPAKAPDASSDPFVPPERLKKADRADARADLFGLGALLKLLLTGQAPSGKEPKDLPDLPASLRTVLSKTLDPMTGKRFLDHTKLLEELERAPGMKGVTIDLKR